MVDEPAVPGGIAGHLREALIGAHGALADRIDERKKAHVASVLDTFEADIAPLLAPLVQEAIAHPAMPEHLKPLLAQVAAPDHFSGSLLIGVAVGAIIGPVLGSAVEPYVQAISNNAWAANPSRPISPEILVAAVLKGVEAEPNAAPEAARSGYSSGAFATMVAASGQAIGLAEALLLLRRAQISDAEFTSVLQYSNQNPRFYGMSRALKYAPLSVGEAVTAALKGHMSDAEAATAVGYAGIDPVHFPVLKASAGRPLGLEEMLHLWNRGIMSQADVEAGIRQSDINDAYLPFALELRHYFPPPRSVVPMLRANAITEAQARQLLTYYGVGEPWQSAFIAEGKKTSSSTTKTLTQAQVTASYETRLITRAAAITRLETAGYDAADAAAILDLADEKRTIAMADATQRLVGSRYITRKIGKPEATTQLNAIPIPTAAQADLFHLWDIERKITVHHLTPAQVIGGYRRGQIGPIDCKARLIALGVQPEDMAILVADGFPPTKPVAAQAAANAVVNA